MSSSYRSHNGASTSAAAGPTPSKPKSQMSAAELQAAQLERLMAHPEKEVRIPAPRTGEKQLRAPREIMKNVMGSSAGAGSGEFHVYKHARRREYERVKIMEEQDKKVRHPRSDDGALQVAMALSVMSAS